MVGWIFLLSGWLLSSGETPEAYCALFPESETHYVKREKTLRGENAFFEVIDEFRQTYRPLFLEQGLDFQITGEWEDERTNAQATRDSEGNPVVRVYGGLARHPLVTPDALRLLVCHEIGHFLGGAPKSFRGRSELRSWSSAEGQADYFATAKCLKTLWADEEKEEDLTDLVPVERDALQNQCQTSLCRRIALAGKQVALLFHELRSGGFSPEFHRKDSTQVSETQMGHPFAQCRLDTYVAGARCAISPEEGFDPQNAEIGACGFEETTLEGARPRCWFQPEAY